jgi:alpha-N-arabinofuranosidase
MPLFAQTAPPPAHRATITIDASKVEGTIPGTIYGQFLEYMFQCIKSGVHAELVRNRGFEEPADALGLSRYWEPYPDGRNDLPVSFASDSSASYPGRPNPESGSPEHALRVDVRGGPTARQGICQGGIPIRRDRDYVGSVWMKTARFEGRVRVSLESEIEGTAPYAEGGLAELRDEWALYRFRLRSRADDPQARLVFAFSGRGRLWLDQVSLLPADAVDGVRRDVFERVAALRPAFIRWPGGNVAQDYHWQWGIGPLDSRVVWKNLSWKNEQEPSDFGTDEYLRFCQNVGARPTIVVNIEGRGATVDEAAAWVEYCNGPATSKFGGMRAAAGHPAPYAVHYWELGNEIWGDWVRGHSDAETYARNYLRYQAAMRAIDPTIELIACGDNNMNWNRTVLREAGPHIDLLSIHHYYSTREMAGDPLNLMAHPLQYEKFYREVGALIRQTVPARPVKLAINEWGLAMPVEQAYSMDAALYAGRMMNVFERSADLVAMTSVSDLVNGWTGGIIQASRHGLFVTSIYLVNKLYNEHLGKERLAIEIESPVLDTSREGRSIPLLDATASRSADGKLLFLKAVNTDRNQSMATLVAITGAAIGPRARVETIQATKPGAFNHFATPEAITTRSTQIAASERFLVDLPPAAVAVITLDLVR